MVCMFCQNNSHTDCKAWDLFHKNKSHREINCSADHISVLANGESKTVTRTLAKIYQSEVIYHYQTEKINSHETKQV